MVLFFYCRTASPLTRPGSLIARSASNGVCTPVMGVNLWGASPLYEESNPVARQRNQVLAEGKGVSARRGLEEAGAQSYEPTNRNSIQGHHPGKSAQHDEVPRIQEKW